MWDTSHVIADLPAVMIFLSVLIIIVEIYVGDDSDVPTMHSLFIFSHAYICYYK